MALFRLFLGIALLVMGRRLFWLFLGGVGFVAGFDFAERILHDQTQSVILIIALFAGALGAMVAIFLQNFAVVAGGFLAGGYLLIELLKILDVKNRRLPLVSFYCGRSGRSCPYFPDRPFRGTVV